MYNNLSLYRDGGLQKLANLAWPTDGALVYTIDASQLSPEQLPDSPQIIPTISGFDLGQPQELPVYDIYGNNLVSSAWGGLTQELPVYDIYGNNLVSSAWGGLPLLYLTDTSYNYPNAVWSSGVYYDQTTGLLQPIPMYYNNPQLTVTVTQPATTSAGNVPPAGTPGQQPGTPGQQPGTPGQQPGDLPGTTGGQPGKPTDIFTADYMLNNIAPSGAVGLGVGALAGALSGSHPVKTSLGAGVGAFGGKMLYDYLANNKDTKLYIQKFLDWASKNLWDGAGEHVQYLAPILGGLAGFALTK